MAAERTPEERAEADDRWAKALTRAHVHPTLLDRARESAAAWRRGARGTPGKQIHDEIRRQRDNV